MTWVFTTGGFGRCSIIACTPPSSGEDTSCCDSVVVETRPGRIEAIVLAPGAAVLPRGGDVPGQGVESFHRDPVQLRAEIDAQVKAANATLAVNQRVVAWRLWPDADFPRTHTLKVKRDRIRAWAVVEQPLPVSEEAGTAPVAG